MILDEVGYIPFEPEAVNLFFQAPVPGSIETGGNGWP